MKEYREIEELCRQWTEAVTMRSMHSVGRYIKATGLSMAQFTLLMFLKHGGGCGVRDIGTHLGITSAAASQLVDRLVQHGLADRTEDPRDRRGRSVRLSGRGSALLGKGIEERFRWIADLVSCMTEEERKSAGSALPALIRAEKSLPPIEHPPGAGKPAACRAYGTKGKP
jgi:DNA-binding MarR family transcriptional regulator